MELAVEFRVEVALDFLVEPRDHLPNALLNLFAGRSPLPRNEGGVVGLSKWVGSVIIDTTTVEASLQQWSVVDMLSPGWLKTNSS